MRDHEPAVLLIMLDISSWYFTKIIHPFAFVVMAAGAISGICFACMWVITMYQMWLSKPPLAVLQRMGGDIPSLGVQHQAAE